MPGRASRAEEESRASCRHPAARRYTDDRCEPRGRERELAAAGRAVADAAAGGDGGPPRPAAAAGLDRADRHAPAAGRSGRLSPARRAGGAHARAGRHPGEPGPQRHSRAARGHRPAPGRGRRRRRAAPPPAAGRGGPRRELDGGRPPLRPDGPAYRPHRCLGGLDRGRTWEGREPGRQPAHGSRSGVAAGPAAPAGAPHPRSGATAPAAGHPGRARDPRGGGGEVPLHLRGAQPARDRPRRCPVRVLRHLRAGGAGPGHGRARDPWPARCL